MPVSSNRLYRATMMTVCGPSEGVLPSMRVTVVFEPPSNAQMTQVDREKER